MSKKSSQHGQNKSIKHQGNKSGAPTNTPSTAHRPTGAQRPTTQANSNIIHSDKFVAMLAYCVSPNDINTQKAIAPVIYELINIRKRQSVEYDGETYDRYDPDVSTIIDSYQNDINHVLGRTETHSELCLVYGGATKIKGYVFESSEISEIRGASAIFDWVNSEAPNTFIKDQKMHKECLLYGSGGNVVAFAPLGLGDKFAKHIENTYTQHTLTGQSVAVSVEIRLVELVFGRAPDAFTKDDITNIIIQGNPVIQNLLQQSFAIPLMSPLMGFREQFATIKGFGELITVVASMANARRDGEHSASHIRPIEHEELTPWTIKCHTSDIRPAAVDDGGEIISLSTERKRVVGRSVKGLSTTNKTSDNWNVPSINSWDDKYKKFLSSNGTQPKTRPAYSFEEIAAACKNKTIGIIYADGNNLGQRYASMITPQEYKDFSNTLTKKTQEIVFTALRKHIKQITIQPFEIIAIGGDDCFIVVPGDVALQIALEIGLAYNDVEARQPETANHRYDITSNKPSLSLSAGVVIADHKTPFFLLERLVNDLLKNAKKLARTSGTGTVDFISLVSLGAVADSVDTIRDAYTYSNGTRLTARPYTWEELEFLLKRVQEIHKELSGENFNSHLYRIANVMHTHGRLASDFELQATVAKNTERNGNPMGIARAASYLTPQPIPSNSTPNINTLSLWYERQQKNEKWYETLLIDLMEILDIVKT